MTTGLLTDRYEIAMVASLLHDGKARTPAVFEAFARRLPTGRRYGIVAGLGRIIDAVENFTFNGPEVHWLLTQGIIDEDTADYLWGFHFTGSIDAYREGDLYFPFSPVVTVRGELAQCLLLETLILSILNHDTAVASAAARMVHAANGKPVLEMGSRRTHEDAAVAAARAAYIAGFTGTSNLQAGYQHGVPTIGTAAHAFTLAHHSERDAFTAQIAQHGTGTTLLVDTYDIPTGIRTAIDVAGPTLGAIRIDSGDLAVEARLARELLDSLGATTTKIVTTSDLDEYTITALADSPVDIFGAGTRVVTGSGHPTAGMVYKLVAIADQPDGTYRPVEKTASGKRSAGGRKIAYRTYDNYGHIVGEHLAIRHTDDTTEAFPGRVLQVPVIRNGELVHNPALADIRDFCMNVRYELRPYDLSIASGKPSLEASL